MTKKRRLAEDYLDMIRGVDRSNIKDIYALFDLGNTESLCIGVDCIEHCPLYNIVISCVGQDALPND